MKLQGKVALITGAARGIGRAHALRLAKLGADIVVNDVNLNSHQEYEESAGDDSTVDAVKALGVKAIGIECNAGKKEQADEMIQQTVAEFGKIDILVNNSGGLAGEIPDSFASIVSVEDLNATMERNLNATIYCSQAAAIPMKEQKWGRIVNTASQAGLQAQGGGVYASYGVAKAGIISYTRYLAEELGPFNITVNCIAPAYISTERLDAKVYSKMENPAQQMRIPLGTIAKPDEVSKVVEFFVTDLADYITGQTLSVCGGALKFR
jgi:3-oxoacyl-[acyl-carrier protein] reductase